MKRRIILLISILAVMIVFPCLSVQASAADIVASGYCGGDTTSEYDEFSKCYKNAMWILDEDGTLTISGEGKMMNSFYNCCPWYDKTFSIKNIIIENGITNIGDHAFEDCNISNVTISDSVTRIGAQAFTNCTDLTNITIPNGVTSIGGSAFNCCFSLTSINIPNSVSIIEGFAFGNCNNLKIVTIGRSVTEIGHSAFYNCESLRSIVVSESNSIYCSDINGVLFDKAKTKLIQYPTGNTCTTYIIPDSVINICDEAFMFCDSIESISIGNNVTSIGKNAFNRCRSLRSMIIPNSVINLGEDAFEYCTSLSFAIIPSSVETIGDGILSSCWNLTDVYFLGTEKEWKSHWYNSGVININCCTIHFLDDSQYIGKTYESIKKTLNRTPTIKTTYYTTYSTGTTKKDVLLLKFDAGIYATEEARNNLSNAYFTWNSDLFSDNSSENADLAIAGLVLSANTYNSKLEKDSLNNMGFKSIKEYDLQTSLMTGAPVHCFIANQKYGKNTLIAISIRGTVNGSDWLSNLVQQVPGFEAAAIEVMTFMQDYLSEQNITDLSSVKFFITGHSRGGAVANIIGAKLNSGYKDNIFVYTYACPNTSTNDLNKQGIFNYMLDGDPVHGQPWAPFFGCDAKYGKNLHCNIDRINSYESNFSSITGGLYSACLSTPDLYTLWCNLGLLGDFSRGFRVVSDYPSCALYHTPGAYMACLLDKTAAYYSRCYQKKLLIKCPVDVEIYDKNGTLLGKIENDVADEALMNYGIYVVVEGHEKYVYCPDWLEVDVKLIGTDTGTMEYTVQTLDGETVVEEKTFSNVALTSGKEMSSAVEKDIVVEDTQLFGISNEQISREILTDGTEQDVVFLTFETFSGDSIRERSVKKGEKAADLPIASCLGYQFDCWCTDENCTTPFNPNTVLNDSIKLYAKYSRAYDVYARYSSIVYDGQEVAVTLSFEYCDSDAQVLTALYQNGKMLAVSGTSVSDGTESTEITLSASELFGVCELKTFIVSAEGSWSPLCSTQDISFYIN